jgi:hypothetical protein
MRIQSRTVKIAGLGAAALLAAAATTGAASATAGSAVHTTAIHQAASVTQAGPDTDNLQQGDQTTPDVPGATDASDPADAPAGKKLAVAQTAGPTAEKPGTEAPDNGTEKESASDGPGGHADAPGAVDHQFQGNE